MLDPILGLVFFQIVLFFRVAFWGFVFKDVEDDGDECGVFIIFQ